MKISINDFVTVTLRAKGIEVLSKKKKVNLMEQGTCRLTLRFYEILSLFGGEPYNANLPLFEEYMDFDTGSGSYRVIIQKTGKEEFNELLRYVIRLNNYGIIEVQERFLYKFRNGDPCIVAIGKTKTEANIIKEYLSAIGAQAIIVNYTE